MSTIVKIAFLANIAISVFYVSECYETIVSNTITQLNQVLSICAFHLFNISLSIYSIKNVKDRTAKVIARSQFFLAVALTLIDRKFPATEREKDTAFNQYAISVAVCALNFMSALLAGPEPSKVKME